MKKIIVKLLIVAMLLFNDGTMVFATENNIGDMTSNLKENNPDQYADAVDVNLDIDANVEEDADENIKTDEKDDDKIINASLSEVDDEENEDIDDEDNDEAIEEYEEELEEEGQQNENDEVLLDVNIEEKDINILKAIYPTQKIIIDFGKGPHFEDSNNWAGKDDAINVFTNEGDGKYSIEGPTTGDNCIITKMFEGTGYPSKLRGGQSHVWLPMFNDAPNAVWQGYKFTGWLDNEGKDIVAEQGETFELAFQGNLSSDTTTYIAQWEAVEKEYTLVEKHGIIIDGVFRDIFVSTQTMVHRTNVDIEPKDIPGYKKDDVTAFYNGVENIDALKTLDYMDNFVVLDEDEDLQITSQKSVVGAMPNHDLEIRIMYISDDNITYNLHVKHISLNSGVTLQDENIPFHAGEKVETTIDYITSTYPNYDYLEASLSEVIPDESSYVLPLGVPSIDGQILSPTDASDTSANKGRFYAIFPNQDMSITYFYELTSGETEVIIKEQIENRGGGFDTVKIATISIAPSDPLDPNKKSYTYTDRRLEGYASIPQFEIVGNIGEPTLAPTYITDSISGTGSVEFWVSDFQIHTIYIQYVYDSEMWTHVQYYYDATQPGHLEAEEGTYPLSARYFLRYTQESMLTTKIPKTYTIAEIMQGVKIVPNSHNYKYGIYRKANEGNEWGTVFANDSTIEFSQNAHNFFVKFEEDPNRWVNVTFQGTDTCQLSNPPAGTIIHIPRDTVLASISFPTTTVITGYAFTGNWVDTNGVVLTDTYFEDMEGTSMTIYPQIVDLVNESETPVKPLGYTKINVDKKSSLYLYTRYPHRRYVLTDANDKYIITKVGEDLSSTQGFDNLMPGKSYKLYEIMTGATEEINSQNKLVINSNVSAPFIFGIQSIRDEDCSYDKTNRKINIVGLSGISYALLDDKYNIVYDWTTNPNFINLQNGTYYLVVAKQTSDVINPDDDNCIKNGVVVYTEKNEDVNTKRLVLVGDIESVQGTEFYNNGITGKDAIKAYYLDQSSNVQLMGGEDLGVRKKTWDVLSNNVVLTNQNSVYNTIETMPNEDVIIKAKNYSASSSRQNLYTYSLNDTHMSFSDKDELFNWLNTDDKMQFFIENNAIINYSVVIRRRPTKKDVIDSLVNKIAPYEYTVEAIAEVNTYPYSIATFSDLRLPVYVSIDEGSQKCRDYSIIVDGVEESIEELYPTADISNLGSYKMSLKAEGSVVFKYEKMHTITLKSNVTNIVPENTYKILDGLKMSEGISDYVTNIQSKFADCFDMTDTVPTSKFSAKEYFYKGVHVDNASGEIFDATNSIIKRNITLYFIYDLNIERENAKNLLNNEIVRGNNKKNTLHIQAKKAIVESAVNTALGIKNYQNDKTVEEILDAYHTLKNVIDNTYDEATIILEANGGEYVEPNSITIAVGPTYRYASLSNVTAVRSGYNFVCWNTESDGSGTNIYPTTIVSSTPSEVLYAMWEEIIVTPYTPTGGGRSSGGSSNGGGGGGGGSSNQFGSTTTKVGEKITNPNNMVQVNNLSIQDLVLGDNKDNTLFKTASTYEESNIGYKYDIMQDGNIKLSILKYDGDNTEKLTNQLLTVKKQDANGVTSYNIYSLDENGFAKIGLNLIQNNAYYFDEKGGDNYASLKIGLITSPINNMWYYADKVNGKVLTGWQNIDGGDYCFRDEAEYRYDENGNKTGILKMGAMHGAMYFNCTTPDGHKVGVDGKRIPEKPGMN